MKTILVVSDLQYPYTDFSVWNAVLRFAKELKPDQTILNGDGIDFYDLSKYDKNPQRTGHLVQERDGFVKEVISPLKNVTKGRFFYTEGNHEQRLKKYIWHQAPALSGLKELEVPEFLELDKGEYQEKGVSVGKHLYVTHGFTVRAHSAYTAKAHWDRYGTSLVIGHTHRIGQFMIRDMKGIHEVVEAGCLCDLEPEYDKFPNWQQGFAVIHLFDDGMFNTTLVKIVNRQFFCYGNKVYNITG